MNSGDFYIFNNIVKTLIQWSINADLQPQESQVARSQIKHADEHPCTKSDLCLEGCFCAAEAHRQLRFNFIFLFPPLLANNGAVPTPSVHWHLSYSPLGVRVQPLERDGQMGMEVYFSQSPDRLHAAFVCMKKEKEGAAGQPYPQRWRCNTSRQWGNSTETFVFHICSQQVRVNGQNEVDVMVFRGEITHLVFACCLLPIST